MKILQFLRDQDSETIKESCVIPVLEILRAEGFNFVVMPRWGPYPLSPWPKNAAGILPFMHSMLKALNFLHNNNIAHLDISEGNILVNQFDDALEPNMPGMREGLRSKGCLHFAMFDFDFSIKLPPEANRKHVQYSVGFSLESWIVRVNTAQGEPFINPFVLDVGILGGLLSRNFQHLTGTIPLLAPFLDKMTTRVLSSRFTAKEALSFFEEHFLTLPAAELDLPLEPVDWWKHCNNSIYKFDRWAVVTPTFAKKWVPYREPITWYRALLRRIVLTKVGAFVVYWVRWIFEGNWGRPGDTMWIS